LIYVLCQTDKESKLALTSFGLKGHKKEPDLAGEKMCEKVSDKMKGKVVMQSQVKHYF
jgi:hypothetical protein